MESVLIDSDGHVSERDEVILEYLPEPFRGRRELLARPLFPLGDHFHRMAEGMLDSRRNEDRGDEDRSALPVWQALLDESGMKWSALYPTRGLYIHEWHSPEWGGAVVKGYNDWIYDAYVSKEPRLKGIALLHLLDIDAAVAELRRCVEELGFEGAVLMCGGLPRPLGDPYYFPLYEEAQRLDVGRRRSRRRRVRAGGETADALWKVRAMSHPSGQITSFMSIVNGGVLDAFPDLRVGIPGSRLRLDAVSWWTAWIVCTTAVARACPRS